MIALVPFFLAAQETHTIKWLPVLNQPVRYLMEGTAPMAGGAMTINFKVVTESKTIEITEEAITSEERMVSLDVLLNGNPLPAEMMGDTGAITEAVMTMKRDRAGKLIGDLGSGGMPGQSPAITRVSEFLYPAEPKTMGESWTREFAADAKLGLKPARTKYTLKSIDDWGTRKGYRIDFAFSELEGAAPMGATGKMWLDTTTGELLEAQIAYVNASMAPEMPVGNFSAVVRRMN
jgi:hypothetical protein